MYIKPSLGSKGSQSAKRVALALTEKLGYKVWRSTKDNPKKRALLYGQGVDKLTQYQWFANNNIPALEFTTDKKVVLQWLDENHVVFGRTLLNSSCGKGILIYENGGTTDWETTSAPVYTKYKKKKREFRVHIFEDKVVRVVEKKLRKDWNGSRDSKIRNLANGFVFCACAPESEPPGLRELALSAACVVASSFKGVDIGYNEKLNELFVIEVNSAPGIEGSNVDAYVNTILA